LVAGLLDALLNSHFELKYRAKLRGFDLTKLERIIEDSDERYYDTISGRSVVVGRHGRTLVLILYECTDTATTPITVHATTRQQIDFRLKKGRFIHEQDTTDLL
jgi:hypothetical protein